MFVKIGNTWVRQEEIVAVELAEVDRVINPYPYQEPIAFVHLRGGDSFNIEQEQDGDLWADLIAAGIIPDEDEAYEDPEPAEPAENPLRTFLRTLADILQQLSDYEEPADPKPEAPASTYTCLDGSTL